MTQAHDAPYTLTTFRYDTASRNYFPKAVSLPLGATEVLVRTSHSGICFTDVHAKPKGCGLGHEGVGHVLATGAAVSSFSVGDRVGWGWLHHSCGTCEACLDGYRQYCADACGFAFGELDQGSMGDRAIRDEAFVYRIPDSIKSEHAAPLMCAGASVYEALDAAGVKPSDCVGVVGLGGLGHMAVQFASAMGCAVTAFSRSPDKAADFSTQTLPHFRFVQLPTSHEHGGDSAPASDNSDGHAVITSSHGGGGGPLINVLLITSNAVTRAMLAALLPRLARRATIVLMTIQTADLQLPYMDFVLPGHRLIASTEASCRNHVEMLRFAARHRIEPQIELFDMNEEGVGLAFARLEAGKMRYRGVLVATGCDKEPT